MNMYLMEWVRSRIGGDVGVTGRVVSFFTVFLLAACVAGSPSTTGSGFSQLNPQLAAADFDENGSFSCVLTNTLDVAVNVTSATIAASMSPRPLSPHNAAAKETACRGWVEETGNAQMIGAGENFMIRAEGCVLQPPSREPFYKADVVIVYDYVREGDVRTAVEKGTLLGPIMGEAYGRYVRNKKLKDMMPMLGGLLVFSGYLYLLNRGLQPGRNRRRRILAFIFAIIGFLVTVFVTVFFLWSNGFFNM